MRFLILFFFFLSQALFANTEKSLDEIIKESRVINKDYRGESGLRIWSATDKKKITSFTSECHTLTKIILETNGIITLEFSRNKIILDGVNSALLEVIMNSNGGTFLPSILSAMILFTDA